MSSSTDTPAFPSTLPAATLSPPASRRHAHRARRWVKRIALALGVASAAAVAIYTWLPKPLPVDTAVVGRHPLEVTVDEDGRTRVRERFVVSAPVGGNLERIELEAGATVTDGDPIARIRPPDPAMLDPRSRAEAQARLTAALAHVRQAETAVTRARAAAVVAERDGQRAKTLFERQAIPAADRERAELAAELAIGDRAAAELQRKAAAAEVEGARAVLGNGGRAGAAVVVPAPVTGRILRVLRDDAGPVATGTALFELGDPATLEVVVDVLSSDAARISVGAAVVIDGWGGTPLTGKVRLIEPAATTRVSALGVEEQRVDVIVALDSVPPELGDGFRVETRIQIWRGGDVLTVPAGALFRDHGRWAVYVVVGDRAALRPVEVGHRSQVTAEVTGGLAVGDTVIVHPSDRVADGIEVRAR